MSVTGTTGTGKSWFAKNELIKKYLGGPAVIVTYAGMPEIWADAEIFDSSNKEAWNFSSGIKQICWYKHEADTAKHIFRYCRDKILVFDDCKNYMDSNLMTNRDFKRIVAMHRHIMTDVVIIAHSIADIPPQSWAINKMAVIFHSDHVAPKGKLSSGRAANLLDAQKRVSARYQKAYNKNNNSHYGIYEIVGP
jgi:hypothetical protein